MRSAHADRITELTTMLASSSDKTRLSAVTALARLGDKRSLKPLVTALADPNAGVRTLAAKSLGSLGHKAALPALRTAAADDTDAAVRAAAKAAATMIAKANNVPDVDPTRPAPAVAARSAGRPGFGQTPRAVEIHPDLYISLKSSSDDSPGKHDKAARKVHGDVLRQALTSSLKGSPLVTMAAADATRWSLDLRQIDLSVVKMEVTQTGKMIEVDAQLRLAISDDKGRMMSFLSGGAKVQVPKKTFNMNYLPNLRKEALENAMRGMFDKLIAHMRNPSA
ncbi:MAG: HEAT repeat domain-containing protein [Deltaproteobacteria bacterium]|nr:HEAT repeat domain-containing protein [Deltaproteobacteria bacterium]